jgi:2-methylisocitrate lyase-like PEP mutase family enzyme
MSIEDVLHYRAVREAVRFPALLNVQSDLNEADAYTLLALGVQAMILTASENNDTTQQQIKALRELLEKVHQEEKDSMAGLTNKQ